MSLEDEHICPNCEGNNVEWVGDFLVCFDCNTEFKEEDE